MTQNIERRLPTSWYVITGGPCSGKSTTVELLKQRGYRTTIEGARHFLETERANGRTFEEVRRNQLEFQSRVLGMQIEHERMLPQDEVVFLDRAIPDARAYYRFLDLPEDERLAEALEKVSYKKVFILDPLPLVNDYARRENEPAQRSLHRLITEVYRSLPFPVIEVPVMPAEHRVEFILARL